MPSNGNVSATPPRSLAVESVLRNGAQPTPRVPMRSFPIPIEWGASSVGRALRSQRRGRGFNSPALHQIYFPPLPAVTGLHIAGNLCGKIPFRPVCRGDGPQPMRVIGIRVEISSISEKQRVQLFFSKVLMASSTKAILILNSCLMPSTS
jgi:hypothetical protein